MSNDEEDVIKKSVQIDLEIDTTHTDSSRNPFQKIIFLARAVDSWRIFPRLFIGVYIYILYTSIDWFLLLETPTAEQTTLISVITGLGAAWFGLYVNSGRKEE